MPNVGCIVDLTATSRYYDPTVGLLLHACTLCNSSATKIVFGFPCPCRFSPRAVSSTRRSFALATSSPIRRQSKGTLFISFFCFFLVIFVFLIELRSTHICLSSPSILSIFLCVSVYTVYIYILCVVECKWISMRMRMRSLGTNLRWERVSFNGLAGWQGCCIILRQRRTFSHKFFEAQKRD